MPCMMMAFVLPLGVLAIRISVGPTTRPTLTVTNDPNNKLLAP